MALASRLVDFQDDLKSTVLGVTHQYCKKVVAIVSSSSSESITSTSSFFAFLDPPMVIFGLTIELFAACAERVVLRTDDFLT